jgi:signal transduction histidine kinase
MQEPGTGIGLVLAKEFVQKNNGTMFIVSKPGEGTKVRFTLPLVE